MGRYIIRRILQAIPLLFLLTIFMFTLIHLLPGGPDQVIFNPHLSPAGRAALRARFGLDQPVPVQYLKWLGNALTGNFGFSFGTNQPVGDILKQRFPATLAVVCARAHPGACVWLSCWVSFLHCVMERPRITP